MNIIWREFNYIDVFGRDMQNSPYFPQNSGTLLLHQVMTMPKKKPISMQDACMMASFENCRLYRFNTPERLDPRSLGFMNRWVQWISEQGYHIELTGDEFEIDQDSAFAC